MIFATVGTQLPFTRLMAVMAQLPGDEPIFAQVGPDKTHYPFPVQTALSADAFDSYARRARVIVSHAGVGTVLTAMRFNKPLILVPRRAALNEHRNDHQLATARQLQGRAGLYVAWHPAEIKLFLGQSLTPARFQDRPELARLIQSVRDFVNA